MMRKTNLIQLTIVALLLLGINSQAANATVFVGVQAVTKERPTSTVINTVTESKKEFRSLLPSLDGTDVGTFANFSASDPAADANNSGILLTGASQHFFEYPEIVGPAVGIFYVDLYWNDTFAPDIDLRPGYINATDDGLYVGYPDNVTEYAGSFYGSSNPEYYAALVNLTIGESCSFVSIITGYDNLAVNFSAFAAWINYDEYISSIGYIADPQPEILKPVDGGSYGISDLDGFLRYIPLNYSYVPGIIQAWSGVVYEFAQQDWDNTFKGGNWKSEIIIDGVSAGQIGGDGVVKLTFEELGTHNITALAWFDDEIIGQTTSIFTVEEPTLGVHELIEDVDGYTIKQEFFEVPYPTPMDEGDDSQIGNAFDTITLNYFDQGTDNIWHEVEMVNTDGDFYEYTIADLIDSTLVFYYFTVTDVDGFEFEYYAPLPYYSAEYDIWVNSTVVEDTSDDSPALLAPLAIAAIGLMAIVRRRK